MTGIIGVWTDSAGDPSAITDVMLNALKHRGTIRRVESVGTGKNQTVSLGSLSHEATASALVRSRETGVAFYGSFYDRRDGSDANYILRQVEARSVDRTLHKITNEIGGFAGIVAKSYVIYAFRDINGLKPLYYARSPHLTGIASERKALWRIGLKHPNPAPPGSMISLTGKRLTVTPIVHFRRPRKKQMTFERASSALQRYLSMAIRRITSRTGKVCVAFSGGLDSAVTAAIAKKQGVELQAVSVGLAGAPEVSTVEKFAAQLGLRITLETFPSDLIEEYLRRVLWLIEEPNLMKLSVAIPLHWAAMVAARCGCKVMLCGQGSDELYGGYSKYATTLRLGGRNALTAHLYRSVVESSQVNYERDDQATSPFPVELRTPFADPELIKFSLTIPSEFKVRDGDDVTRKWVLRDVAKSIGVPDNIVWRRKKAIQHGTGVEKAVLRLAKSRGLKTDEYLSKTFEEVSSLETMP